MNSQKTILSMHGHTFQIKHFMLSYRMFSPAAPISFKVQATFYSRTAYCFDDFVLEMAFFIANVLQ